MKRRSQSKGPTQRQLRVGEEMRHALSRIIERGDLHDPALAGVSITVTEVRTSPDMKNATAYVMPLGGADADAVMDGLVRATPFIRREVARFLTLRNTPRVSFALDTTFDEASHIDHLLRDPAVARDLARDADPGADDDDDPDGSDD